MVCWQGYRYQLQEVVFCMKIWRCSPKAYRFLRSRLPFIPSTKTLRLYLQKIPISAGFNKCVWDSLARLAKRLPDPRDKVVALLFDEMSLMPHFYYCKNRGKIVGFVDNGLEDVDECEPDHKHSNSDGDADTFEDRIRNEERSSEEKEVEEVAAEFCEQRATNDVPYNPEHS